MLKKVFILFSIIFAFNALSFIYLDVEVIHEKGFDDKMILKSELMSREKIFSEKPILLQMKNGLQLSFFPKFNEEKLIEEKESIITVEGVLQDLSANSREPKKFNLKVKIGEKGVMEFKSKEGQKTRITVKPVLK